MPADLEACVMKVMDKGHDKSSAYAICNKSLGYKEKEGMDAVIKYACELADEKSKMFSDLKSINGVEIFAAGEWNNDKYTEEDLDQIVNAFNETKDISKPYLKLGHGSKQKLLEEDELPAAGYVNRIYRAGKKIVADFVDIPAKIFDLIQKRAYTGVSSEIFVNFKSNGKVYPFALKAVALLGAATKAVHSLNDILSRYSEKSVYDKLTAEAVRAYEFEVSEESEINPNESEDTKMTIEELSRQNANLEAKNASIQKEYAELEKENKTLEEKLVKTEASVKEFQQKLDASNKAIQKIEKETKEKEIDAEIKEYVKAGKIVPAQAPFLKELLNNVQVNQETKEFTIGEKKYANVQSLVKGFMDAQVEEIDLDDSKTEHEIDYSAEDKFHEKVKKYAEEKKVSYKDAFLALSPNGKSKAE